ncbi:MAG: putative inorganic carbon transporter subunit DabA, partial [Nitrospirales bacterium]
DQHQTAAVRPLTQAVLCIDVRSEGFRRHLEEIGGYETLGFAGFFAIPFRFRPFGSHHETDQCPVLLKPKHIVREVPRAYQSLEAEKHLAGKRFLQTGHQLLYDLKENVITPYVMVEAMGWFYAIPFILKTTMATRYREWASRLRRAFSPPLATTLTVNKVTQEEALEMLAVEQRPTIRRALREQLGLYGNLVSPQLIETLRRYALEENDSPGTLPHNVRQLLKLAPTQEAAFIDTLRRQYDINSRGASGRLHRITRTGFTLTEQVNFVATNLLLMGLTKNFSRLVLLCGHGSTSENNPFESALDCGACGGNHGMPNARTFAAMANKPDVRELLGQHGISIPPDTYFLAGEVDTATDATQLFDLEDVPSTHRRQLSQLIHDLKEAGRQNSLERCGQFPDIQGPLSTEKAAREVKKRSLDWSQVRPEWGLSRNAAFIIGRHTLTKGLNLEGRTFLHSYDYHIDPTGKYLQIILTAPGVVVQWISMEHYLSTVDPEVYGSGSKMYHNVTGRIGVMFGTQSDLRVGLPWQTVMDGERPYHEAMRPLYIVEAPRDRISMLIQKNEILRRFFDGRWVQLIALEPEEGAFYHYVPKQGWSVVSQSTP